MTNNDILRRLRYIFDISDAEMIAIFASTGTKVTRAQISDWLKREEDEDYKACKDMQFALFLNGFINVKRGKKDGPARPPETQLNNNIILKKLKIALNLQADDMLEILGLVNSQLSKHELSALFRKSTHKHYRECKDQIMRNFLTGLQWKHRPEPS